jgi:hypothetical protein
VPDQYYAACVMKKNGMTCGTGDFNDIIEILGKEYKFEYKDIGNKLDLVRKGFLYGEGNESICLYTDSKKPEGSLNYKKVFLIWKEQVYLHPESGLTTKKMIEIFPELEDRLNLYDNCCNEYGKIVKKFDYYN